MMFRVRHILLAALLHLLLFAVLAGGLQCSRKPQPTRVIEAVLYDPSRQQVKEQDKQRAKQQREVEEKKRKAAEQKKRQAEAEKKAEAERKKKEAEAKAVAEAERKRKAAEAEARAQEEMKRKQAAEEERRTAEMKAQMRREIEQENLRRQMEEESKALRQKGMEAKINEWAALVERHIKKNWIRPGGATGDFTCTVQVQLLPDGSVTSALIVRSCGSALLNKSVEDAVFRSSPIPRPTDPAAFDRDLTVNFTPQ